MCARNATPRIKTPPVKVQVAGAQGSSANQSAARYCEVKVARSLDYYPHAHTNRGTCPVWGSDFTTKASSLKGDSENCVLWLNEKSFDLLSGGACCVVSSLKHIRLTEDIWAKMWSLNAARRAAQGQCAPSPQACRHAPAPRHSRRRPSFIQKEAAKKCFKNFQRRREATAKDSNSQRSTCYCTNNTSDIYSFLLYIYRIVLLLLR